jgi:hypothetical protein
MTHTILAVAHSGNSTIAAFMQAQVTRLAAAREDITFAAVNEHNLKYQRHQDHDKPNRFPLYMYLKNNVYVTSFFGKNDDKQVLDWINSLGI